MAITRVETQVTWSAAASKSLNANTAFISDAITIDPTTIAAAIQVMADNSGTPASGDNVTVQIAYSSGDILGDTGNDFDTTEHAQFLTTLDTFATDTPGEDPVARTVPIAIAPSAFKIIATAAQGATRAITFYARLVEKQSA